MQCIQKWVNLFVSWHIQYTGKGCCCCCCCCSPDLKALVITWQPATAFWENNFQHPSVCSFFLQMNSTFQSRCASLLFESLWISSCLCFHVPASRSFTFRLAVNVNHVNWSAWLSSRINSLFVFCFFFSIIGLVRGFSPDSTERTCNRGALMKKAGTAGWFFLF